VWPDDARLGDFSFEAPSLAASRDGSGSELRTCSISAAAMRPEHYPSGSAACRTPANAGATGSSNGNRPRWHAISQKRRTFNLQPTP